MRGNACDGKHNATIAWKLTNAGGSNNKEHSIPMHNFVDQVKEEECKVRHLGNEDKHQAMAQKNVSVVDTFRKAEELCVQQTTEGDVHWRPALNMGNANLAQIQPNESRNNKRFKQKSNFKKKFNCKTNGNRKNRLQKHKSWRDCGPKKGDKPDCYKGKTPVFKKTVKGRDYEWCEKCNNGQGQWTATHNTAIHRDDFNEEDAKGKSANEEANLVDSTYGLQLMFLIAKSGGVSIEAFSPRKHGGNRRQSTKQFRQ